MTTFTLVVANTFWESERHWPQGSRPVVFSVDLVTKNAGTLQVPVATAAAVEAMLRAHPHVIHVERHVEVVRWPSSSRSRRAA